ncbi:hypothetical protein ILUMI_08288, partial [Ignelater luminosus]
MPRNYIRKSGSRRYADYSPEVLEACLQAVKAGMSTRLAEHTYNIPRRTIINKLKGRHVNKPGFPAIFTYKEERSFVQCIHRVIEFGFPVNEFEFRTI